MSAGEIPTMFEFQKLSAISAAMMLTLSVGLAIAPSASAYHEGDCDRMETPHGHIFVIDPEDCFHIWMPDIHWCNTPGLEGCDDDNDDCFLWVVIDERGSANGGLSGCFD